MAKPNLGKVINQIIKKDPKLINLVDIKLERSEMKLLLYPDMIRNQFTIKSEKHRPLLRLSIFVLEDVYVIEYHDLATDCEQEATYYYDVSVKEILKFIRKHFYLKKKKE